MLLFLEILSLANILLNLLKQFSINSSQYAEIRSSRTDFHTAENLSTSFHRRLLYDRAEANIPRTRIGLKYFLLKDYTKYYPGIHLRNLSKLEPQKEEFTENGIEFDLRKREDAYTLTDPREYPYAVLLVIIDGGTTEVCSGSLITLDWVLTAAHCIKPIGGKVISGEVWVYAGGRSFTEVREHFLDKKPLPLNTQLKKSEKFLPDETLDIALVKLPEKFNLTDTVKTINISTEPWNHRGYQKCVTTAFGRVSSKEENKDDRFRKTHKFEVKQPCICSFLLKTMVKDRGTIRDYMCAKPVQDYGVCFGDSGGGLICDGKVTGVNMQLFPFENINYCEYNMIVSSLRGRATCGSINTLSMFQSPCRALPWINKHVKLFPEDELSDCKALPSDGTQTTYSYWAIATLSMMFLIL